MVLSFSDSLMVVPGLHGDREKLGLSQTQGPHKPGYI